MADNKRNYIPVYCSLHNIALRRLKRLSEKQKKTESQVLRQIIDAYLQGIKEKDLSYRLSKQHSPLGLKCVARTIGKEQDARLRRMAEKTGRSVSELVREAVERISC